MSEDFQDKKIRYRLYAYLLIPWPIAGYAIFVSFSSQYSILFSAVAVIIEIILVLYYRKKIGEIIEKEVKKELSDRDAMPTNTYSNIKKAKKRKLVQGFAIIVVVYGAIAGLALTQAMIDFSDQCINEEEGVYVHTITKRTPCFDKVTSLQQLPELILNDQMLLVMSFFIIGTAFYHCGILFLYPTTMEFISEQSNKLITANSLIIFAESVTLFFAATSSDSIEKFSLWIIMLLFLDVGWGLLNFFYKDKSEASEYRLRAKKQLNALYLGWAHLEGTMLMFFITTSIFLTSAGGNPVTEVEDGTWIHVVLLFVSIIVIITIYEIGWEWFWAKFKTGDE